MVRVETVNARNHWTSQKLRIGCRAVETVFRYSVIRILRKDVRHDDFLTDYDYPNARQFLKRFETAMKTPEIEV